MANQVLTIKTTLKGLLSKAGMLVVLTILASSGADSAWAQDAKEKDAKSAETSSASSPWDPYLKEMGEQILHQFGSPSRVGQYKNMKVELRVRKDGKLSNSHLTKSSQIVSVDHAAKRAVIKAAPFKPFPEGIKDEFARFEVNFDKSDIAAKRTIVKLIDKNWKREKEEPDGKQSF
jgi:TonB family protein